MHHTRWEDAVSLMHQRGTRAAQIHERVGLADAIGRILAQDFSPPASLQFFRYGRLCSVRFWALDTEGCRGTVRP